MIYEKKKIMNNKHGTLYSLQKLIDDKFVSIIIPINKIQLLFDPQRISNKIFLKWKLTSLIDNDKISELENSISKFFNKEIKSNLINKANYPTYLSTQIKLNNKGSSIISDENHHIESYEEYITKKNKYNIVLEIKNIFEKKNILNYTLNIKKISIAL